MANEFKVKNGLIVIGELTTSGTITINGALAATQSWVTSQAYLTSSSLTSYATQSYVTSAIASLVDSAPGALDTLRELATALGNDASFSTTVTNSIAAKLPLAGGTLTGLLTAPKISLTTTGNDYYLNLNGLTMTSITTGETIWRNLYALRFSDVNDWDYNSWAGLKFINSTKQIVLGVAGNVFTANSAQTGTLLLDRISTVYVNNTSQTVWHSGNLTNLNQLTNGPGYITSYTEVDTLATVTGRGASTSTAVTFSGGATISGTGGDGAPTLRLISAASDIFNWASDTQYANLTAGETSIHLIGKANSQYNQAYFGYRHVADGSASNMLTLGLYASDYLVNILGNGNVGIGTTSPTSKLQVNGNIDATGVISQTFWTNDSIRKLNAGASLNFRTAAGPIEMILDGSGNLGIGTASPGTNKLHVFNGSSGGVAYNAGGLVVESSGRASIQLLAPNNQDSYLFFGDANSGTGGYIGHYGTTMSPADLMVYYSEGNHNFTNGNVGIGISSPAYKLDVVGAIRSNASNVGTLNLGTDSYSSTYLTTQVIGQTSPSYASTGKLSFKVLTWGAGSDYGPTEQMYIDVTGPDTKTATLVMLPWGGNVGIGTSSPSYKLQVNGDGNGLYVLGANTAPYTQTIASFVYGGNSNSINIENQGGKASIQARAGGSTMDLLLNPVSGNVVIGTTSPFTIGGTAKLSIFTSPSNEPVTFGNTNSDALYIRRYGVGNYQLQTTTGTNAGNISLQSYGGNVGIGTTTTGSKLHVLLNGNTSGGPTGNVASFQNSSSGSNAYISLFGSFSAEAGIIFTDESEQYKGKIGYDNISEYMYFQTDGSEKVRITSAGNVVINSVTTPYVDDKLYIASGNIILDNNRGYLQYTTGGARATLLALNSSNNLSVGQSNANNASLLLYGGTGNVTVNAGAIEVARFTTAGNVGIGTTSPTNSLEVQGAANTSIQAIFQSSSSGNAAYNGGIQLGNAGSNQKSSIVHTSAGDNTLTFTSHYSSGSANKFIFAPGGTETVRFQQNGNVGIGTTDPTSQMSGTVGIGIYNALYPAVGFKNSTTAWLWYGQDSTFRMWNATFGDILTANTSGNIGIGTSSPAQKLDVTGNISLGSWIKSGSTYVGLRREDDGSFGGGGDSGLVIESYNHASPYAGNYSQRVHLRTHLYNGGSNNVLTAYGTNVGIGTSTPGYKLETIGNARISGNLSIGTTYNGFAANIEGIVYVINGSVWVNDGYGYANASSNTGMFPDSSHNISFKSNNSTKVYINAAGNVGIGTDTPASKLSITGTVTVTQGDYNQDTFLNASAIFYYAIKKARGTSSVPLALNTNDKIGGISASGYTGSGYITASAIEFRNSGAVSASSMPTSILFYAGSTNFSGTTPSLKISETQNILINSTASDTAKLSIKGSGATSATTSLLVQNSASDTSMAVLDNGNVGIGTSSPAEELHVIGRGIFDGGSGNSSTDAVVYITKSTNDDWGLYVNNTGLDYGTYTRVSPSANYALAIHNGTTWTTRITGNAIIYLGEKNAIEGNYDSWLRLNNSSQYASGVYTPGVMRADGGFNVSGSTVWHAGNDGSGSGLDADLLDGQNSTEFLRLLSGGAEASLDSYTDNGIRVVNFTEHSQHLLSWNAGGSTGTVQQLFHYGTSNNGWRIRNKTDNSSWSDWGYVVMASSNQGLISGTIATQSWVGSQSYATTSYVTTQINNLVNGAPGALDTLNELATALGNDASFSTTVTNSIAGKVSKTGDTMTGALTIQNGVSATWDYMTLAHLGAHARINLGNAENGFLIAHEGTTTATFATNGNLTITGALTESSSIKLKENVETSGGNLEKVVNLRPVTYNKIGSQTKELGLIAEEVATVYPEFVQYDESGEPVGVNYSRLTAALIGAVKELTQRIETLENNG